MKTKDVILELRTKKGLSQDGLAEKAFVTRQAVSRWETGETVPNTETLKLLSKLFDVSINTLLGSPRKLICQCCGMPLEDSTISRETDGTFQEDYCKWCYTDGKFVYTSLEELTDYLVAHMSNANWPPEQVRAFLEEQLPKLKHWQQPEANGMRIREIQENKKQYMQLLFLADEQEDMIDRYLDRGTMYVLEENGVKAECVVTDEGNGILEIKNIATLPAYQKQGYARKLIEFLVAKYAGQYSVLQVGTGDSPRTIPFYETCGFTRSHVVKDFFVKNYHHTIFEGGKQLVDMIYLQRTL